MFLVSWRDVTSHDVTLRFSAPSMLACTFTMEHAQHLYCDVTLRQCDVTSLSFTLRIIPCLSIWHIYKFNLFVLAGNCLFFGRGMQRRVHHRRRDQTVQGEPEPEVGAWSAWPAAWGLTSAFRQHAVASQLCLAVDVRSSWQERQEVIAAVTMLSYTCVAWLRVELLYRSVVCARSCIVLL